MIKNYKLKDAQGACTLEGYFSNGASHVHLPVQPGKNTYRIHVQKGEVALRHETRGYDIPTAPLDGQPGKYNLESGKVYEISLVADTTYGVDDGVLIANEKYFQPATFFVEVLETGENITPTDNAIIEYDSADFYSQPGDTESPVERERDFTFFR